MISVIIPVYNPGKYLQNCIESIIKQTYRDLQIIFVNDGSTDNSGEILAKYAEIDDRITVITQENQGVCAARNKGLQLATGEYITFVDSDDELDLKMYETLLSHFSNDDIGIVHCGYRRIFPDGTYKDVSGTSMIHPQSSEEALTCLINGTLFVGSLCNKLYKRALFDEIYFDPKIKINEDILINYYVFKKINTAIFIDEPLYHINENHSSASYTTAQLNRHTDVMTVSKLIFENCVNTSLADAAATRYYWSICGAYRAYLYLSIANTKNERKALLAELKKLNRYNIYVNIKQKLNLLLMRITPHIYKFLYTQYRRIYATNADVKA